MIGSTFLRHVFFLVTACRPGGGARHQPRRNIGNGDWAVPRFGVNKAEANLPRCTYREGKVPWGSLPVLLCVLLPCVDVFDIREHGGGESYRSKLRHPESSLSFGHTLLLSLPRCDVDAVSTLYSTASYFPRYGSCRSIYDSFAQN